MIRQPEIRLFKDEACADLFAGGGRTSTGIEAVLGRSPDVAINHDRNALAMHKANHPATHHLREDMRDVDPVSALGGKKCGFAWFSPDCTYHSKARGGQPFRDPDRARRLRGLVGVVIRWAATVRPRVLFVENVEELEFWCPLGDDGRPDPEKRGQSFRRWVARLRNLGYVVEWRQLVASHFGAPTSRKRPLYHRAVRRSADPVARGDPRATPSSLSDGGGVHRLGAPREHGIDPDCGLPLRFTKKAQTKLVGNSVPPHVAAAVIGANLSEDAA